MESEHRPTITLPVILLDRLTFTPTIVPMLLMHMFSMSSFLTQIEMTRIQFGGNTI